MFPRRPRDLSYGRERKSGPLNLCDRFPRRSSLPLNSLKYPKFLPNIFPSLRSAKYLLGIKSGLGVTIYTCSDNSFYIYKVEVCWKITRCRVPTSDNRRRNSVWNCTQLCYQYGSDVHVFVLPNRLRFKYRRERTGCMMHGSSPARYINSKIALLPPLLFWESMHIRGTITCFGRAGNLGAKYKR